MPVFKPAAERDGSRPFLMHHLHLLNRTLAEKWNPMKPSITVRTIVRLLLIHFSLWCLALSPVAQGVIPSPDGGYPGGNTAEEQSALLNLTSGTCNAAVGLFTLDQVNATLLNEFLKEHKNIEDQQVTTAEFKKEIAALTATLQEQAAQIRR
jgi:hypothetical protein